VPAPGAMPRPGESCSAPAHRSTYASGVPLGLGVWEIVILVVVLALLFGAKGVPGVARRLGTGVREVKDAVGDVDPRRMLEPGPPPEPPATTKHTDAA
jgi:sec-independent protein translocase protein TatA